MLPALTVVVGYLLGSLPFGYLIVRAKEGADVRETGSGGTGATNVSRRAGKWAGLLTLALDAAKGYLAVLLARWWLGGGETSAWWITATALAAIAGHIFPVWLRFRGGKGVATGLGVFGALAPLALAFSGVVFLLAVIATRYVSLGSILGAGTYPLWVWLLGNRATSRPGEFVPLLSAALMGAALIIVKHHANIGRLIAGTESRFR